MARRPLKHEVEAYRRAHERVGKMTRDMMEASSASRSRPSDLMGRERLRGVRLGKKMTG